MTDEHDPDGPDAPGVTPEPAHPPRPSDDLARGTIVGRYSILGRIDSEGDQAAYAAYDADGGRKVSLKFVRVAVGKDDPSEEHALVRIAGQTQRIAKLSHPCIAQVYEVGVFGDRIFMATEFLDGINLRAWMEARDDPFPWRQVLRVFREAARGLAEAHQAGIVHRDFKPANVVLGKSGRIVVVNFGAWGQPLDGDGDDRDEDISELRRQLSGTTDHAEGEETPEGSYGTAAYTAPEQLVSGRPDPRSDQFSFCASLYEALYGERPFVGNRPIAIALQVVAGQVRPAPGGSDVPPWLREVVLKGLSPLPEDRYPSMHALLQALAADPPGARRRWLAGGVVVAIVGSGAFGVARMGEADRDACSQLQAMAGVWDLERRQTLRGGLAALDRSWTEATWSTMEVHIDRWAQAWTRSRELSCMAGQAWGGSDDKLRDRRRACMDRRREDLAAIGRVLSSPSPEIAEHAHEMVLSLRLFNHCRDDEALRRRVDPPEESAELSASLWSELADARAFLAARQYEVALRQANELANATGSVGQPAIQIEVAVLAGRALFGLGRLREATTQLQHAATLANRAGLEAEVAEAYTHLGAVLASSGAYAEANRMLEFAAGLVQRLGLGHLAPTIALQQGKVAAALDTPSLALSKIYRAIKLENDRPDMHPVRLAPMWIELGRFLLQTSDAATAVTHFEDAVAVLAEELGPQHPAVGDALIELATAHQLAKQDDQAVASLAQALEIRDGQGEDVQTGMLQLRLGDALLQTGAASRAAARFAAAEVAFSREASAEGKARAAYGKGMAQLAGGATAGAAATLTRAVEYAEALPDRLALADARFALARALWHDPAQRSRALTLAGLAERAYSDSGDERAEARAAVQQWAHKVAQSSDPNPSAGADEHQGPTP